MVNLSRLNGYREALRDSAFASATIFVPIITIFAFFGPSINATATHFLILLAAALAIASFSATTGILSFGHVAFMGVGAHVSALLTMPIAVKGSTLPYLPDLLANISLPFLPAMLITVVVVAFFAFITGIPISRLGGSEAAIATLALLVISGSILVGARDFTRGSQALFGIPKSTTILVAFSFFVVILFATRCFTNSRTGLLLRAVREDEPAAVAIGIRPQKMRLRAWMISGTLAGVAGVLFGHFLTVFSPKEFYFDLTFSLLVILILGGFASISGVVVGAVLVTALVEILRRIEQSIQVADFFGGSIFGLTSIGLSLAVLGMLYWRNEGLLGHREFSDFLPRPKRPIAAEIDPVTYRVSSANQILDIQNLSKSYGGVHAVDDVSFLLKTGEIVGLIGPNGSGKTTALGCIAGTHELNSGKINLRGNDITHLDADEIALSGIGRTFQTIRLFHRLSVWENVAAAVLTSEVTLGLEAGRERARGLLKLFGIEDLEDRQASTLAYGQQRRLEIARAMALAPAFLLLDEPAAGMNEEESDDLMETLLNVRDKYGVGIMIIDHDLRLITRLCDRIVVLNKGKKIAEGTPEQVTRSKEVLTAYLGTIDNK
jgi:branched-chain amino acid transport system permease protein